MGSGHETPPISFPSVKILVKTSFFSLGVLAFTTHYMQFCVVCYRLYLHIQMPKMWGCFSTPKHPLVYGPCPKKRSLGRKLTFTSPQKVTRSPTCSPTCTSISQQVTQHAGRSPQKGTLSPNKFTNMQEILEALNSCHEGRYNIEVTN